MGDYVIKKGDNLTNIAKQYGVSVKQLQELNGIKDPNVIIAGKSLKLPDNAGLEVEHNQTTGNEEIRAKREAAHKKAVEEMQKNKELQAAENSPNQIQEVTVIGKKRTPEIAKAETKTEDLIKTEMEKRGLKNVDIPYWTEKINHVSSEYDISPNILVSIISRETKFTKNRSGSNGKGAMQQTSIAIKDLFPTGKKHRNELYAQLDEKLVNDILYKKDADGNVMKDSKGQPVLKYSSAEALLKECARDDELSIKVGALLIKMQYASAIARNTGKSITKVIDELKENGTTFNTAQNKKYIASAIQHYNGNPRHGMMYKYRTDVLDSLQRQKFDFAEPIIKKS